MKRINIATMFGVAAAALVMATNAQATVTMTLMDATSLAANSGNYSAVVNGYGQIINQYDLIGLYKFSVTDNSGPAGSPPALGNLWATCVSPAGLLDWSSHTYDTKTFAQEEPGSSPSLWAGANNVDGGYGIQNANYLFSTYSGAIINGGTQAQGVALALAMYDVLYNSTGLGVVGNGPFHFTSGGPVGEVLNDYNGFVTDVFGMAKKDPVVGNLLVPNPTYPGAGQDQIFLASGSIPQTSTPVPEPSTILAGALMLLPLGASALRILRKSRVG